MLDTVAPTKTPGLDITCYDPKLGAAENLLATPIGKELILRDKLRATRTHCDDIVVDCPPNLGGLCMNGPVATDQVWIPRDPSPLSVRGMDARMAAK